MEEGGGKRRRGDERRGELWWWGEKKAESPPINPSVAANAGQLLVFSPSRMYVSGLHSMVCSPEGVLSVTLYWARTTGRVVALAPKAERLSIIIVAVVVLGGIACKDEGVDLGAREVEEGGCVGGGAGDEGGARRRGLEASLAGREKN